MGLIGSGVTKLSGAVTFPGSRTRWTYTPQNRGNIAWFTAMPSFPGSRTRWAGSPVGRGTIEALTTVYSFTGVRAHTWYWGVQRGIAYVALGTRSMTVDAPAKIEIEGKQYIVTHFRWRRFAWNVGPTGTVGVKLTCGYVTIPPSGYATVSPLDLEYAGMPDDTALTVEWQETGPGGTETPELLDCTAYGQAYVGAEEIEA